MVLRINSERIGVQIQPQLSKIQRIESTNRELFSCETKFKKLKTNKTVLETTDLE